MRLDDTDQIGIMELTGIRTAIPAREKRIPMTTETINSLGFTVTTTNQGHKWSCGDWFAVVDDNRHAEALLESDIESIQCALTVDADCGGIFDCSDRSVCESAGLISPAINDEESSDFERELRSQSHEYYRSVCGGIR